MGRVIREVMGVEVLRSIQSVGELKARKRVTCGREGAKSVARARVMALRMILLAWRYQKAT